MSANFPIEKNNVLIIIITNKIIIKISFVKILNLARDPSYYNYLNKTK